MGHFTTRYLNAPLYCQICKITEPRVVFLSVDGSSILATFLLYGNGPRLLSQQSTLLPNGFSSLPLAGLQLTLVPEKSDSHSWWLTCDCKFML